MAQVLVNFRLEEEDKKGMEEVCHALGMSMSTAFLQKKCVVKKEFRLKCQSIPFILKRIWRI